MRELKERLAEANISTFAVSGTNLAARDYTDKKGQADTSAILAKRINDFPNKVLRVQLHGEPVPIPSKQDGVTHLKIPIIVFVDQKAYAQEAVQLATTLDKPALQRVSGNLKLKSQARPGREALRALSGVQLLPNDEFIAYNDFAEGQAAVEVIYGLLREAQQKFGTLPETPGVITLMSGLSATGTTRLSLFAMNKAALGSVDAASPCKIVVTVGLADASGAELDSTEHSLEPEDENHTGIPFVFEKGAKYHTLDGLDVRISPGLRTQPGGYIIQISTSWTGDVYADIETEMLPRLQSVKLSVKWSGPNGGRTDTDQRTEEYEKEHLRQRNAPLQQPSSTPREGSTANSGPGENPTSTESQVAASPNTTPQSMEARRAEPVRTSTINPPQGSGEIPGQGMLNGERYPQTRQRLLTLENIKGFNAAEVRYAINEIYARYGATFPNHPDVQQQFQKFDWYHPDPKLTFHDIDQSMSDIERENVKVLARYRAMTSQP